jgi:hypothetical protein
METRKNEQELFREIKQIMDFKLIHQLEARFVGAGRVPHRWRFQVGLYSDRNDFYVEVAFENKTGYNGRFKEIGLSVIEALERMLTTVKTMRVELSPEKIKIWTPDNWQIDYFTLKKEDLSEYRHSEWPKMDQTIEQ